MKKNKISEKVTLERFDGSANSVIGLYEMLAQAQPDLINEHKALLDYASLNSCSSSISDE